MMMMMMMRYDLNHIKFNVQPKGKFIIKRTNRKPLTSTNFGKSNRGDVPLRNYSLTHVLRDSRNFSGHPCIGRIARSSLR